jgi:hypothetical protein
MAELSRKPTDAEARFTIAIAPGRHVQSYQYAELEASVDELRSRAFTLRLDGSDVMRYRVEQKASPRVEVLLRPAAWARLAEDPNYGHDLHSAFFDVRLDGKRQFVAMEWPRMGAAGLQVPVVHIETPQGSGKVMRIGAQQGAWYGWGNFGDGDDRIDPPALRDLFRQLGRLDEVPALTP